MDGGNTNQEWADAESVTRRQCEQLGLFANFTAFSSVSALPQHTFQDKQSLAEVWAAYQNGERPAGALEFSRGL
jgi:hypothetical protein